MHCVRNLARPLVRPFLLAILALGPQAAPAAETVDYVRDVLPILERHCLGCHSEGAPEGGFVMETHQGLMRGGESGLAVTPGEPGSSRMFLMASGKIEPVMPPDGEERLGEQELAILAAWIEQGATGPEGDVPIRRELRVPEIEPVSDAPRPITALARSADGLRAIARFGTVEVRDADDRPVVVLERQPGKVNGLQFSRDGKTLLVATGVTGAYGLAAIYDIETGKKEQELVGHRDTLYAARFSPDEQIVATAGYDREIILWDAESGQPLRTLRGHNGAVFDLAFSPDGSVLVSACADETAKVWHVATGERLDTLSQPEAEVFAVGVTPDGKHVIAGSADNRLRVWRLLSRERPRINPIVATRFVDESPLVDFEVTPDGRAVVVLSEAGNVKLIDTDDWNQLAVLEPLGETASDIAIDGDGETARISTMDGRLVSRKLPQSGKRAGSAASGVEPIYLRLGEPVALDEAELRKQASDGPLPIRRGSTVSGDIASPGEVDAYRWPARAGEVWAIDVDAIGNSRLDPIVSVVTADGQPIVRTRLQAVRDSYFTFRGKNSTQSNDFRLFAWQEMHLNDYLYAAGEVSRLWMHPRGPDSGFNVYPGQGTRWTYFGTTHATHALGEPAYIVRPLAPGEEPLANGLPVFDVTYQNDDDPMRSAGKNSRLLFTAPADAVYTIRVADTRGFGGPGHDYELRLRAADPDFRPSVKPVNKPIPRGGGREFTVNIDRLDGFEGPVTFELDGLPPGVIANTPLVIEAGQQQAVGTIWAEPTASDWEGTFEPRVTATAMIRGQKVERRAGTVGKLTLGKAPDAVPVIQPIDGGIADHEPWTLQVRRGETVTAELLLRRREGFDREVSFGKEFSARNAAHGVYVDNIGLNGLLVRQNESEREFFLTADPVAALGKRSFFLTAGIDGGVTSRPITVEVIP